MPNIEDLGKAAKRKYPGVYDDLSDAELGKAVKTKYPGVYDDFKDIGLVQSIARSIAKPVIKAGVTGGKAVAGLAGAATYGVGKATGSKTLQGVGKEALEDAASPTAHTDFGYFGQVAPAKTAKEAVGTGLELGANVVGGTGVGTLAKTTAKGLVKQGLVEGAKAGALAGGLAGTGVALEEDESAGDVVKSGITGALEGGALGGALGAAGASITRKLTGKGHSLDKIARYTRDPFDKQAKIDVLKQTGKVTKSGQALGVKKSPILGKITAQNAPRDLERAAAVQEYVIPNKPIASITKLNQGIEEVSDKVVRPNLKANPRAFNLQTLQARLAEQDLPISITGDQTQLRTYKLARDRMLQVAQKYPKTMEGLWDARREFDAIIKKDFGDLAFTDPRRSTARRAVQDMRRAVNDFISDEIGDGVFAENMKKLSYMYESLDNIAEANQQLLNTSAVRRFFQKHPNASKGLWLAIGTTGVLGGASKVLGSGE